MTDRSVIVNRSAADRLSHRRYRRICCVPHPEQRALARVSKDGCESVRCVHPSRRLLRKLLRMRSVFFTGSFAGDDGCERSEAIQSPGCHCEPTGRANARPMTGSAKQSILPRKGRMDCFAALAMTGIRDIRSPSRGARRPSCAWTKHRELANLICRRCLRTPVSDVSEWRVRP